MAINAACVWEVRTTGANTNSGGFVPGQSSPGADYSQRDTPQYALTNGSTTSGSAVISTASASADMKDNIVYIVGGSGTPNPAARRQITAVNPGVSITVDSSAGITTATSVTLNIGGALSSPGLVSGFLTAGNIAYVKSGTYSITTASLGVDGGALTAAASLIIGYDTNRVINNTDTKPIIQYNASSIIFASSSTQCLINLQFDGNGQTSSRVANNGSFIRCMIIGMNSATTGTTCMFIGCSATGCSAAPFTGSMVGCEAYANTCSPYVLAGGSAVFCLSYNNTGSNTYHGFALSSGAAYTVNCVAYNNGGSGFNTTTLSGVAFINCHAQQNGLYGFNCSTTNAGKTLINCSTYLNGSGSNNITGGVAIINLIQITDGDPLVNVGTLNFTPNSTSLRGALMRAAGFPSDFKNSISHSYHDIGAIQHQDTGGGGGGVIGGEDMTGGCNG
jgi:hypothetical protein